MAGPTKFAVGDRVRWSDPENDLPAYIGVIKAVLPDEPDCYYITTEGGEELGAFGWELEKVETGITEDERAFLQAKADGRIPATTGWADWLHGRRVHQVVDPREDDGLPHTCNELCDPVAVARLEQKQERTEAVLLAADTRAELAEAELRMIDAVLARRPALDKSTRRENIEHAITTAARADKAEAARDAFHADIASLRVAYDQLQQERAKLEMRVTDLAEVVSKERDARLQAEQERDTWLASAREYANGLAFYRGIVEQTGAHFGPAAYTSDDGSIQDSVLALKVPELALQMRDAHDAMALTLQLRDDQVVRTQRALLALQGDKRRLRELLEAARLHIHNEFSPETHVETYHRLTREIDAVLEDQKSLKPHRTGWDA